MAELTRSAILRISDEKTLQLLELYRGEECLWNTGSEDYNDKEQRTMAAERIARQLALEHFDASHVSIKFKNLRNSYCQQLKKVEKSAEAGGEVYTPTVFWFDKMDSFLRPHLKKSRTSPFVIGDNDELSKDSKGNEEYFAPKPEPAGSEAPDDTDEWIDKPNSGKNTASSASESSTDEDDPLVGVKRAGTTRVAAKRIRTGGHSCDGTSAQMLKSISSRLEELATPREDTFDTFGKYIASLLRNLPAQRALHLQPKIVTLVTNSALRRGDSTVSQSGQHCNSTE